MRIAQVAPLWLPVPPFTYGGIESMMYNLTEELVKRGHQVTLYASGDSKTSAQLKFPIEKGLWLQKDQKNPHAAVTKMLYMIRHQKKSFDLIHNHFKFFIYPLVLDSGMPPMLTTIHNAIDPLHAEAIKLFPSLNICVLSEDARKNAAEHGIRTLGVVPNGIDPKLYEFNDQPEDYLLYLGRVNKGKGITTALNVAKKTNSKLIVAGNIVGAEEWSYFMQEVQSRLNEQHVKFVGQVNFQEKIKLLKNAKALLFPIEIREAFGLILIEAMACGTPVLAFRRGSVPEIIEHGKTGFVMDTEDQMAAAVNDIGQLNRQACRDVVKEKYTIDQMTTKYEALYKQITNK